LDPRQPSPEIPSITQTHEKEAVLELENLRVHFEPELGLLSMFGAQQNGPVKAVDGIDLAINRGHTLGLVGESGSGKTTIARAILGLIDETKGDMRLFSEKLAPALNDRDLTTLSHLQIVFQNPHEALNPYLTIGEAIRYPLEHLLGMSEPEAWQETDRLLQAVHLTPEYAGRLPSQLSGGEKQRVAVARAFASHPELLVADEPVTSLDVSVQASILNLLNELQAKNLSSYLLISHDLAVVGYLADQVAVIYLGKLMEVAPSEDLFEPPYHPYTEALLSSIPLIDPKASQERIRLEGEVPSPVDVPSGCPFHSRCPRFLGEICVEEVPPWRQTESGKRYFCHIPVEDLAAEQSRVFRFEVDR
jgi:peptide/nickel transport system ATP-binding protein